MRNKKKDDLFSLLPQDLGFVINSKDPLNIILSAAARMLHKSENILDRSLDNSFIDRMDPNLPYLI